MAKGKGEVKGWITRHGVHVPIYGSYTVRGGTEPKAKGSRFKGFKKKESPEARRAREVEQNQLAKEKFGKDWYGLNDEEKAEVTKSLHTSNVLTKQEKAKAEAANSATKGESGANKGKQVEGKGAVKDVQGKKYNDDEGKYVKNLAGKYEVKRDDDKSDSAEEKREYVKNPSGRMEIKRNNADRDYNELADAHKAGYSAQSDEGKPSVDFSKMKYSEAGAYVAAHKKDFGLNDDDDAYQAAYEMKQGTWKGKMPGQTSAKTAANGAPRVTDAEAKSNKLVEYNGQRYQTQPVVDWDKAKDQEYIAGHLYVPVDPKPGKSQFFVANEDGSVHQSGTDYLRKKNALPNPWRDKAEAAKQESATPTTNKTDAYNDKVFADFKANGKDYQRVPMEGYAGTVNDFKAAAKRAGVDIEYDKGDDTFYLRKSKQESSTPDFSKMSYSEAGKHVAANKARYGLKDEDDAYLAAAQMKNGTWKGGSTAQENRRWADDMNKKTTESNAGNRYSTSSANYGNTYTAQHLGEYSISGLKKAYTDAPAALKSKIKAEMQKRGYKFSGGKWIKG